MIGFTSTTFRPFTANSIIKFAKKANASCIEWGGDIHVKDVYKAKYVKERCEDSGIAICSYGSYYKLGENNPEKFKKICEITSEMDAQRVRIWFGTKSSEKYSENEFNEAVEDGKRISEIAKDYNITVSGECHPNTYNDSTQSSLKLIKAVNEFNFKSYFQSMYVDIDYDLDRFKQTLEYTNAIHISFSEMHKNQKKNTKDNTCCQQILREAKANNFNGDVLLEYVKYNSPTNFYKDMAKLINLYN